MQFVSSLWWAFPSLCRSYSYLCTSNCQSVIISCATEYPSESTFLCLYLEVFIVQSLVVLSFLTYMRIFDWYWIYAQGEKHRLFHYSIGRYTVFSEPYIFWWKLDDVSMWICFWVSCPIPSIYMCGFCIGTMHFGHHGSVVQSEIRYYDQISAFLYLLRIAFANPSLLCLHMKFRNA